MILSINFSNKNVVIIFIALLLCLLGYANARDVAIPEPLKEKKPLIAVLPVENLSGTSAPVKDIRKTLVERLEMKGVNILENDILERFIEKHRMRYTGGIDTITAKAFKKEGKTDAVIITSIELYNEVNPPKIALTSRLVSTGDKQVILWMDSIGLAGDDSPGILGLGLIEDPEVLMEKALRFLTDSLASYLWDKKNDIKIGKRSFQPKISYNSDVIRPDRKYTVVVMPFLNKSRKKNGGEIMMLQFLRALTKLENFNVIEPGIVRQKLLNMRIIMDEGISINQADLISNSLNADLIFTGKVMDYQDYEGPWGRPKVDFSVLVIERASKKVIWASESYNQGDDGVFLFDLGRVNTANKLASEMTRTVVEKISEK